MKLGTGPREDEVRLTAWAEEFLRTATKHTAEFQTGAQEELHMGGGIADSQRAAQ